MDNLQTYLFKLVTGEWIISDAYPCNEVYVLQRPMMKEKRGGNLGSFFPCPMDGDLNVKHSHIAAHMVLEDGPLFDMYKEKSSQ